MEGSAYYTLLHDKKEIARIVMSVLGNGKPSISFLDENGAAML